MKSLNLKYLIAVLILSSNFLGLSVQAATCDGSLVTLEDTVAIEYNQYAAGVENKLAAIAKEYGQSDKADAAKKAAKTKIQSVILRNSYLELILYSAHLSQITKAILATPDMSPQEIKTIVLNAILERRNRYANESYKVPVQKVLNFEDSSFITLRKGKLINSYTTQPIAYNDMLEYLPFLERKWAKSFIPHPEQKAEILIFPIKDVRGLYVFIANDVGFMNHMFNRISHYVEAEKKIINGDHLFGHLAGGHDLQGKDILTYFSVVNSDPKAYVPENVGNKEEALRLAREKEFIDEDMAPLVNDHMVALAVGPYGRNREVLSHEFIHGQFFLNMALQAAATDFWLNHVSEEDRKLFKGSETMSDLYDPNDQFLMINEFLAYTLQEDAEQSAINFKDNDLVYLIRKYAKPYEKFLVEKGITLVR